MQSIPNFINSQSVEPQSKKWLDVCEPATGSVYARVADSSETDVNTAIQTAQAAFPSWSHTPTAERSRILLKLADLIDANLEPLAQAESRDTGKPIALARSIDIPRSASNFRFFATAILHSHTEAHDFDGGSGGVQGGIHALNFTLRKPRGVAGLISPWNLPLYLLSWKIAPALATGNTAVCKPSEVTPMTAFMLGDLANQAGLPPGVLNIIQGSGSAAGAAIVKHPDTPTISFTGSTAVGKWIAREAGDRLKRVSLELGGKNPFIVFDDADFDDALNTALRAGFTNQGQICLCGSRLLVHTAIYDRFVAALTDRIRSLKIGDPSDPHTQQGALVSAQHLDKVESAVNAAKSLGARILVGGRRVPADKLPDRCKRGYFFEPTLLEGLDPACPIEQEEIFGPVVSLQRFSSDDQALSIANSTPYGLAAVVFTSNLSRAHRLAGQLHAGIVWINCWMIRDLRTPFGGVKHSGVGREGGFEALKFFTEPTNVCIKI